MLDHDIPEISEDDGDEIGLLGVLLIGLAMWSPLLLLIGAIVWALFQ
jgi:uncharacterized RDD family membrane protein YckC